MTIIFYRLLSKNLHFPIICFILLCYSIGKAIEKSTLLSSNARKKTIMLFLCTKKAFYLLLMSKIKLHKWQTLKSRLPTIYDFRKPNILSSYARKIIKLLFCTIKPFNFIIFTVKPCYILILYNN